MSPQPFPGASWRGQRAWRTACIGLARVPGTVEFQARLPRPRTAPDRHPRGGWGGGPQRPEAGWPLAGQQSRALARRTATAGIGVEGVVALAVQRVDVRLASIDATVRRRGPSTPTGLTVTVVVRRVHGRRTSNKIDDSRRPSGRRDVQGPIPAAVARVGVRAAVVQELGTYLKPWRRPRGGGPALPRRADQRPCPASSSPMAFRGLGIVVAVAGRRRGELSAAGSRRGRGGASCPAFNETLPDVEVALLRAHNPTRRQLSGCFSSTGAPGAAPQSPLRTKELFLPGRRRRPAPRPPPGSCASWPASAAASPPGSCAVVRRRRHRRLAQAVDVVALRAHRRPRVLPGRRRVSPVAVAVVVGGDRRVQRRRPRRLGGRDGLDGRGRRPRLSRPRTKRRGSARSGRRRSPPASARGRFADGRRAAARGRRGRRPARRAAQAPRRRAQAAAEQDVVRVLGGRSLRCRGSCHCDVRFGVVRARPCLSVTICSDAGGGLRRRGPA